MTPLEKRLAKRIHNQRVRLRQLEGFAGWQREANAFHHSRWLYVAVRVLKENRELRARLGITEHFDQRAAMTAGNRSQS